MNKPRPLIKYVSEASKYGEIPRSLIMEKQVILESNPRSSSPNTALSLTPAFPFGSFCERGNYCWRCYKRDHCEYNLPVRRI